MQGAHVRSDDPIPMRDQLRGWFQGKESVMFGWAVTFLIIAIVAALLGFGGLAGTAAWMAKVLFVVGLGLFLVLLVLGRRPPL